MAWQALLTIYLDKISGELEEAVEKADLLISILA